MWKYRLTAPLPATSPGHWLQRRPPALRLPLGRDPSISPCSSTHRPATHCPVPATAGWGTGGARAPASWDPLPVPAPSVTPAAVPMIPHGPRDTPGLGRSQAARGQWGVFPVPLTSHLLSVCFAAAPGDRAGQSVPLQPPPLPVWLIRGHPGVFSGGDPRGVWAVTTVSSNPALEPLPCCGGAKGPRAQGPHGGQGGDIVPLGYVLPTPSLQRLGVSVREAGGFGPGWDPCLSRSPRMCPAPELWVRQ